MWCPSCGGEFREGFTRCVDCDVPLSDAPPPGAEGGDPFFPTMPLPVPVAAAQVAGMELRCHNCGHDRFSQRRVQLSTALVGFLDIGWRDRSGMVFACTRCGFVHWFLPSAREEEPPPVEPELSGEAAEDATEPVECLSCGASIPPGSKTCQSCGWSYE